MRPPPRARILSGLVLALTTAACAEWTSVEPVLRSECVPGATGPRAYDALSYALGARIDWEVRHVTATEEITLALCEGVASTVELDAGVDVTGVHAGGSALPYVHDPAARTLSVDHGGAPGSIVSFTVEYSVPASPALAFTTSAADDPVRTRVAFTDSEPRDAHRWLVCKDDPSDRAWFSSVLDIPAGDDAVSNGERVLDETSGGRRRVGYALDVPIPPYLMAFATGELDHAELGEGRLPWEPVPAPVPISLWYRRGLPIDPGGNLEAVADAMATFERLLGPYPFRRYSVVLVPPPFGGGMENATVTFNAESSGTGWVSFSLNAHELAHQWIGDWVTMRTYDDLWVKEGMATLLAAEAQRPTRDRQGRGRLFGTDFTFDPDDAIVDPSLTGTAKYTSGPYQRAASLITQLRAILGEDAFWQGCRDYLAAYGPGSATGEEFLRSFPLDEETIQHALARLTTRDVPAVEETPTAEGHQIAVSDPGGALLVPFLVTSVDVSGHGSSYLAAPGTPAMVPYGSYIAPDERDVHPYPPLDAYAWAVLPEGPGADLDAFLSRSAAHQERALRVEFPEMDPAGLQPFLARLDSDLARTRALVRACIVHGGVGEPAWDAALSRALEEPPILRFTSSLWYCGPVVGSAFEEEFVSLEGSRRVRDLARLEYLLSFQYGSAGYAAIERLALDAPTRELRLIAESLTDPIFNRRAAPADPGTASEAKAARRARP